MTLPLCYNYCWKTCVSPSVQKGAPIIFLEMSSAWRSWLLWFWGLGLGFFFSSKDLHSNLNTRGICIFYNYFPTPVSLKCCPPFSHTWMPLTHWHHSPAILELKAGQTLWEVRMAVLVTTHRANPCASLAHGQHEGSLKPLPCEKHRCL